jgi:drug/metabolite transporter (DMT)-like permease
MIAALGLIWGGTFPVTELALEGITPFWLAASRVSLGAALTVLIWQLRGGHLFRTPPKARDFMTLAIIGALSSAVPFSLLAWGQQYVTAGFAGVSMASTALIVLPLAHFLVPGERITWRRALGFVVGFLGVVILIGGQAFENTGAAHELPGRLACIGASTCYAFSSILMRRLPGIDSLGLAAVLLVFGSAYVIPMAWIVEGPPPMPDAQTLGALAFLGLIPTALANLLRVTVVRTAGPVFMSLVNYQVPLWSVLMGVWFLGEAVPSSLFWAMLLILTGLGLSQYGALVRLFARR